MKIPRNSSLIAILLALGLVACNGQTSNLRNLSDKAGSQNDSTLGADDLLVEDDSEGEEDLADGTETDKKTELDKKLDEVEGSIGSVTEVVEQSEIIIGQSQLDLDAAKELQEARQELLAAKATLEALTSDNESSQKRIVELSAELSILESKINSGLALFEYIAVTNDFKIRESIVADIASAQESLNGVHSTIAQKDLEIAAAEAQKQTSEKLVASLGGDLEALHAELKLIAEPTLAELNLIDLIEVFQGHSAILAETRLEKNSADNKLAAAQQKLDDLQSLQGLLTNSRNSYQAEWNQLDADKMPLLGDESKKAELEAIVQRILIVEYLLANLDFEIQCKVNEIAVAESDLLEAKTEADVLATKVSSHEGIVAALSIQLGANLSTELQAAKAQLALDVDAFEALVLEKTTLVSQQNTVAEELAAVNELLVTWDLLLELVTSGEEI